MKQGIAHRPLADMETNGVYFDKDNIIEVVELEICQYSGLPSISNYEDKKAPAIELAEATI